MRIIDNFDTGVEASPDRAFLIDAESGLKRSYAQTSSFTHRFAHAVRARGLGEDTKIAVLGRNGVLMYETILGILRSDAIWLPVNARSGLSEMVELLSRMDCDLLFYEEEAAEVASAMQELDRPVETVPLTEEAIQSWIGAQPDQDFSPNSESIESIYAIQATGGTTGTPKGVLFSNRNARYIVSTFEAVAPFTPTSTNPYPVYLASAPLTHAAGQLMQLIMRQSGTAVVVRSASPTELLSLIDRFDVTHTFLPPTVIYGMLDSPEIDQHDYSSLQYLIYGASPMSPERLTKAMDSFGPVLAQLYGQTETGVPNVWMSPSEHAVDEASAGNDRLTAAGRVTPGTDLVILDDSGKPVPQGTVGEIAVAGDGVTPGYYGDPEGTASSYSGQYFLTGDIAYMDDEGFIHIVDRRKDMIITGGFNVFSAEVERRIMAFPGIAECAVLGVPDPKWGERVTAFIEPTAGEPTDLDRLREFCREALGPIKTPKEFIIRVSLPRSAVGKVLKRELRQEIWGDSRRRVS